MACVLLVEDDMTLTSVLLYALQTAGYQTHHAAGMHRALALYAQVRPDVVVLDVTLPDGDGFTFCRWIRRTSRVPILFLTARDAEADVVRALELGADDYVTKPFRARELLSRVGALLRRSGVTPAGEFATLLISGDIEVRPAEGLALRSGRPLHLTPVEYGILCHLLRHPNQVLTRDGILESLGSGDPLVVDDNTLNVYIRRLREKIEADPSRPRRILTVRGAGYRWAVDG
jgi:DNA-binding response OmpR family regulator